MRRPAISPTQVLYEVVVGAAQKCQARLTPAAAAPVIVLTQEGGVAERGAGSTLGSGTSGRRDRHEGDAHRVWLHLECVAGEEGSRA